MVGRIVSPSSGATFMCSGPFNANFIPFYSVYDRDGSYWMPPHPCLPHLLVEVRQVPCRPSTFPPQQDRRPRRAHRCFRLHLVLPLIHLPLLLCRCGQAMVCLLPSSGIFMGVIADTVPGP